MTNTLSIKKAFTLIEMIIYIALIMVFLGVAVSFMLNIMSAKIKSQIHQEVNQNLRLSAIRMQYEIRNASAINLIDTDEICLTSQDATYNPIGFYLNNNRLYVRWGGGGVNCATATNEEALTSNILNVTDLIFTDLSSGSDSQNIQFEITIESTGNRQEWNRSDTFTTSAELRGG